MFSLRGKGTLIVFGAIIFYAALAFYSDANELAKNFQSIKMQFIPLILITSFTSLIIRASRQHLLLKSIMIKIPMKENIQLYLAGLSMLITPGGAGEVVKSYFIKKKYGFNISKTIPFVITERFYDFVGTITLIGITIIFYDQIISKILFVFGITVIGLVFIIIRNIRLWLFVQEKINSIRILKKFTQDLPHSNESIKQLSGAKITLHSWVLSTVAIFAEALSVYLSFLAMNIKFDFVLSSQIAYSSGLLGVLSLLPGGLGITEGSMITLLVSNGITLSIASSVVLLMRLTTLWFSTVIGFIHVKVIMREKPIR